MRYQSFAWNDLSLPSRAAPVNHASPGAAKWPRDIVLSELSYAA